MLQLRAWQSTGNACEKFLSIFQQLLVAITVQTFVVAKYASSYSPGGCQVGRKGEFCFAPKLIAPNFHPWLSFCHTQLPRNGSFFFERIQIKNGTVNCKFVIVLFVNIARRMASIPDSMELVIFCTSFFQSEKNAVFVKLRLTFKLLSVLLLSKPLAMDSATSTLRMASA